MELDRNQLKIQAYKEKLSNLEDNNADLRVELTVITQELNDARGKIAELESELAQRGAEGTQAAEDVAQEED